MLQLVLNDLKTKIDDLDAGKLQTCSCRLHMMKWVNKLQKI